MAKEVLFSFYLHMDPTWRRCFDRVAVRDGVTLQPYSVVEGLQIDAFLKLADRKHVFTQGQMAVWRKYLERRGFARHGDHPDGILADIRRRVADGTLTIPFAGETVQDNSMPAAEGLVRNYLAAWPLYRQLAGDDHAGMKIAWLADVFGNNPNLPQILRGIGCEMTSWVSYRQLGEDTWVGIDGSMVLTPSALPNYSLGVYVKNPPCTACAGVGCDVCGGAGMDVPQAFNFDAMRDAIRKAAADPADTGYVFLLSEEALPDGRLCDMIEQMDAELAPAGCRVRWSPYWEFIGRYRPTMEQAAAVRDRTKPSVDLNPAMSGCYVTRIQCKQRTRTVAYELLQAEAKLASAGWAANTPTKPAEEFQQAWRDVTFNHFHDAITGTHIDTAYTELMEMLDAAQAVARRHVKPFRPARLGGFEVLEQGDGTAVSDAPTTTASQTIRVRPGDSLATFTRRLGALDVTFDRLGIVSILRDGVDVFGADRPMSPTRRNMRIGELMLEQDVGDAWGQRIEPIFGPASTESAIPMGDYNIRVEASETAIRWKGVYRGGDPMVKKLSWTVTATASGDGRRVDFTADVQWDAASRRLMVNVPVASQDPAAQFECPFGFVERAYDASKLNYTLWGMNDQNFPVQHWMRAKIDDRRGLAVLNKGIPCGRHVPGGFHLSLLRSPQAYFCIVEPGTYEFWDNDGQRDAGKHRFEYSLLPYTAGLSEAELTRIGYDYNGASPAVPFAIAGDVVVTAWKFAEDGQGWIVRCFDATGQGTTAAFTFDTPRHVVPTDLLERPQGDPVHTPRFETRVHKHGILTVKIW
ncbi:MAG: glycosyl hydrolase-related protein [Phycisphaerae bacterium]|nr:glycosyl hydrolase-related protein [Phycisphaerae bacterium]